MSTHIDRLTRDAAAEAILGPICPLKNARGMNEPLGMTHFIFCAA